MNSSNCLVPKNFLSEEEQNPNFKNYSKANAHIIKEKLTKIPYATDYPFSMNNGDLFAKFSVEYIKNIIFKKGSIYKEKVKFNFFDYVEIFTKSEHTEKQKELFQNIICFNNEKAEPNEYINLGEFDLIIDSIKGEDILNALSKNKYNFFHYPGKEIKKEEKYCLVCEIKLNFFKQIKEQSVQKQFKKYKKILELLSLKPNLQKMKENIGLNGQNELIFMLATNGDFFQFDYMRYSFSNFKEEINTDVDKKNNIPSQLVKIEEISKLNVPVLLLFVPKTLDDNGSLYKNKYVFKIEKEKIDLNEKIQKIEKEMNELKTKNQHLNDEVKELKEKLYVLEELFMKKEEDERREKMLNKKREREERNDNK